MPFAELIPGCLHFSDFHRQECFLDEHLASRRTDSVPRCHRTDDSAASLVLILGDVTDAAQEAGIDLVLLARAIGVFPLCHPAKSLLTPSGLHRDTK